MDRINDYVEEQYEESITWKKVGRFFAKGWMRMIIYVVACVALATAVALPVREFYKSEPVARTTVEFVYSGIENGLSPDGSAFSPDDLISTTVLSDAIKDAGLSDTLKDVSVVRNSMRVESVLSSEYSQLLQAAAAGDKTASERLLDYKFYPTKFNVIISDPKKLGLKDDQARLFLDKVVKSYFNDFRKHYSVSNMFSAEMYNLSQNAMLEFTDAYDMYMDSFNSIKEGITAMQKDDPTFVSAVNNTSFTQLLGELNIIISNYNLFNANILSSNVWRNPERAKSSLEASSIDINNNITPLQEYIKALTKQLEEIKPSETVTTIDGNGNPVVVEKYPNSYYNYHEKLDEANRQMRDYQVRLANITTRLEALKNESSSESAVNRAVEDLANLESETVTYVNKVNDTIENYYEATFISDSVRQTMSAAVTRLGTSFSLVTVLGAAAVIGLLAACIVTAVKIARANAAKKSKQAANVPAEIPQDATESAEAVKEDKNEKSSK